MFFTSFRHKCLHVSQAGLFSAVTSAFIIEVNSQLQPDPNEETAALLRVLIHKVDNTTFGDNVPTVPQPWTGPPHVIVHVQAILFASLAASLFSALLAMLGKQWLNRYASVDVRGSIVERGQNRQRKLDGVVSWYFDHVMGSLPLMLQAALLLLGCALSRYLWEISTIVALVVLGVTSFGVLFYLSIVVAGAVSTSCPYQTPGAHILRRVPDTLLRILKSLGRIPDTLCRIPDCLYHIPDIFRRIPYDPVALHSFLNEESGSYTTSILGWNALREGNLFVVLLVIITLPVMLAMDAFRGTILLLIISYIWVDDQLQRRPDRFQLQQESEREAAVLDLRCIFWTLQTSLDGPVRLSTLKYLETTTLANFDTTLVINCFDIFFGCVKAISHKQAIAQGLEGLATASTLCCLRILSHLTTVDPTPKVFEDTRRRYTRVFSFWTNFDGLSASHALGAMHRIFYPPMPSRYGRLYRRPHLQWESYKPSSHEHVTVARALTKISRFQYQQIGREKVPRWLLCFALHSLSQHPLPPTSVVADCLSIIAIDLGCSVSNTPTPDERCVHILRPRR